MIKVIVAIAAINIGTVLDTDSPISRDYWLKNDGEYGWKISNIYTSCGCTTANYDKDKLVRQGDSICVTLTFNPEGRHGDFNQTGTVMVTDGEEQTKTTLTIEGNIKRSEATIKRQFPFECGNGIRTSVNKLDFGIVSSGNRKSKHVALYNESNKTQSITIRCEGPITASVETIKIEPQESIAVQIFYDADKVKNIGFAENTISIGGHTVKIVAKKGK